MRRPPRRARSSLVLDDLDNGPVLVVNVTVPPLVVLVQLDELSSLIVDHPDEAPVTVVCLEQSVGIKTGTLKQQYLLSRRDRSLCGNFPLVWQ